MVRVSSISKCILLGLNMFLFSSCIDEIDFKNPPNNGLNNDNTITYEPLYIYPFGQEVRNVNAEITITTDGTVNLNNIIAEIPSLKFNKSWLFMLTQDDCMQVALCRTWAAINGKPLTDDFFYDIRHILENDLPPDIYYLNKTLRIDDGTGKDIRFHFTTTLFPEKSPKALSMYNAPSVINYGFTGNYYRFFMKSFLIWDNVIEMLNYGNSIAFHDVCLDSLYQNDRDSIYRHLLICQDSIKKNLSQRGCKVLVEPNGNINYYYSALNYNSIQIMTGQNNAPNILYPFNISTDLNKSFLKRYFIEPEAIKAKILLELQKPKDQREAIHIGVHRTDKTWSNFLLWLNDNYGKDGDNSVWMPSLEEYYEYNYYRIHSTITKTIININTIKITVQLPSDEYFYYPSITLNLKGITNSQIQNIVSNDAVKGLSYANYSNGLMINIDCRKFLLEHATHYVEQYEENSISSNRADALYFTNQLKDSPQKTALLNRINAR